MLLSCSLWCPSVENSASVQGLGPLLTAPSLRLSDIDRLSSFANCGQRCEEWACSRSDLSCREVSKYKRGRVSVLPSNMSLANAHGATIGCSCHRGSLAHSPVCKHLTMHDTESDCSCAALGNHSALATLSAARPAPKFVVHRCSGSGRSLAP